MAETFIGSTLVVEGEITGSEDVLVQGTVRGSVVLDQALIVEESGVVEADVQSETVDIAGQVTGNVSARDKIDLRADCKVVGDIKSPRVLIADGAGFKGHVDMD